MEEKEHTSSFIIIVIIIIRTAFGGDFLLLSPVICHHLSYGSLIYSGRKTWLTCRSTLSFHSSILFDIPSLPANPISFLGLYILLGFSLRLEMVGRVAEPTHSSTDWAKRETLLSVYMTLLRFRFLLARRHSGFAKSGSFLPYCISTLPSWPCLLFRGSDGCFSEASLPRCRDCSVGNVCCFGWNVLLCVAGLWALSLPGLVSYAVQLL